MLRDDEYWNKWHIAQPLLEALSAQNTTAADFALEYAPELGQFEEEVIRKSEVIALEADALSRGNLYSVIRSVGDLVAHVAQGFRHDFTLTTEGTVILNFKSELERDRFLRNVPVAGVPSREEVGKAMLERLLKQA